MNLGEQYDKAKEQEGSGQGKDPLLGTEAE